MRKFTAAVFGFLVVLGCAGGPIIPPSGFRTATACYENPVLITACNQQFVWETVVDVVDDYFRIEHEEPVRQVSNILTEGRLVTFPEVGSTILEPWHHDSVGTYEKLECTLQSIRRMAVVKVMPGENGYWVEVAVFKELENVIKPGEADTGAAIFSYQSAVSGVSDPIQEQPINEGWIPRGRDTALEQRILGQLLARLSGSGIRSTAW